MSEKIFRLFVSSPGDVDAERDRARGVLEAINHDYAGRARLEPLFWEDRLYSAHDTFQDQIPEAKTFDVVVAIFRARLGSPLPDGFAKMQSGEPYPSGSAYEVLSAIEHRHGGNKLPDIFVFRHPNPRGPPFDDPHYEESLTQWRALKGFFERWFRNAESQFVASFQPYDDEGDLAEQIGRGLRKWLADNGVPPRETWDRAKNSPFPGLAAFEADRERVFFGRDLAIRQATQRLVEAKLPFLLILGASGAGKSSLLRAGLMPKLTRPYALPGVEHARPALVTLGRDPFGALAEALGEIFAEEPFADKAARARMLAGDPETAAALIAERLGSARLVVGLDQAERLFAEAPDEAQPFAALLQELCGKVAHVVMTLRADSYPRFQALGPLVALRGAGATYDLLPPSPDELAEIVARPVAACEPPLAFSPGLAEKLVTDARGGDALPLMQMTLQRLYEAEQGRGDGLLSAADYRGMAEAVTETANEALQKLGETAKGALAALVAALVVDVVADPNDPQKLVPVVVPLERAAFVAGRPERAALVDAFVEARLVTDDGAHLRPTHDSLLRIWPDAAGLVAEMAPLLRARAALAPLARGWAEAGAADQPGHLAISAPLLASGQLLQQRFGADLAEPLRGFIAAAVEADRARRDAARRRARLTIAASLAAAVLTSGLSGVAYWQYRDAVAEQAVAEANAEEALRQKSAAEASSKEAEAEKTLALANEKEAEKQKVEAERQRGVALANEQEALKQRNAAEVAEKEAKLQRDRAAKAVKNAIGTANELVVSMAEKLREFVGMPTSLVQAILDPALKLQDDLIASGESTPDLLFFQAAALNDASETRLTLGDTAGALANASKSRDIMLELLHQRPENKLDPIILLRSYEKLGDAQVAQGRLSEALENRLAENAILVRLAKSDPGDEDSQRDLAVSYIKTGDVQEQLKDSAAAMSSFQASLAVIELLVNSDTSKADWQRVLAAAYERIAGLEEAKRDFAAALRTHQTALAIRERLAQSSPDQVASQRDLEVSYIRIGGILETQGDSTAALRSYQAGLAIAERLARTDRGNSGLQLDLSASYEYIGDVEYAKGELAAALDSYKQSLAIRDRLAKSDPGNAVWQRDLSVSDSKLASVYLRQNSFDDARKAIEAGQEIMTRLTVLQPDNAQWKIQLKNFDDWLATLNGASPAK